MNDTQIQSIALSLEVMKQLMRETPDVYADIEYAALRYIFMEGMRRQLSISYMARLLRCTEQEACDKMAAVRNRLGHDAAAKVLLDQARGEVYEHEEG